MTNDHPITPPPELVQQWWIKSFNHRDGQATYPATQAARWGADQELQACCDVLRQKGDPAWSMLRAARRPKPPSLKELALAEMELLETEGSHACCLTTLRRALEQLDD